MAVGCGGEAPDRSDRGADDSDCVAGVERTSRRVERDGAPFCYTGPESRSCGADIREADGHRSPVVDPAAASQLSAQGPTGG